MRTRTAYENICKNNEARKKKLMAKRRKADKAAKLARRRNRK